MAITYGAQKRVAKSDPTAELILTVLSQNTNDINRDRAFAALREKFPSWRDVAAARPSVIARAINVGGLANIKSHRIKKILQQIGERSGDYSLAFLEDMSDEEVFNYLTAFAGVGPKTASCVLLFSLGRPVMPVDTHVYRVGKRLEMIPENYTAEQAHRWFLELNLPVDVLRLHLNMIQHGRILCRPQRPECGQCPLKRLCLYYKNVVHRTAD